MADFKKVLKVAQRGYHDRKDYPPYAATGPWNDRIRWTKYLEKINEELDSVGVDDQDGDQAQGTGG